MIFFLHLAEIILPLPLPERIEYVPIVLRTTRIVREPTTLVGTILFISIFQQRLPTVRAAETALDLVLGRPVPCTIDHPPKVVHLRQRPTETK